MFDDGYESILPAAEYLHGNGMPGNVAVIGKVVELPWRSYLNVFDLRMFQNQWGWNMANHTQDHVDAITMYYKRNTSAYEQDILDGAAFLEQAGLNSAPNWLIYPHGTTNDALAKVVARFTSSPGRRTILPRLTRMARRFASRRSRSQAPKMFSREVARMTYYPASADRRGRS